MRAVVVVVAWLGATVALVALLGALAGNLGAVAGGGAAALAALWAWLWLPRSAHAAFEAGRLIRAERRYRIRQLVALTRGGARVAQLSRAACHVAAGEVAAGERLLAAIDEHALSPGERAVWLNNRACALLEAERDPASALALVDEASALRPDVPALQHTRGMALLAVGRIDEAIAVLDGMRAAGELPARLEAERCRDLAEAWAKKGEAAYAEDYRLRAEGMSR